MEVSVFKNFSTFNGVILEKNIFNFYSNYILVLLYFMICILVAGLPLNNVFIIKIIILILLFPFLDTVFLNILLIINVIIYICYIKILLKYFQFSFYKFNVFNVKQLIIKKYIKFIVIFIVIMSSDIGLLFEILY